MHPRLLELRQEGNPSSPLPFPRRINYGAPLSTPGRSQPIRGNLTPTRFRAPSLELDANAQLQKATWEDLYAIFFTTDPTISRNGQIESKERFPNLFDILPKILNLNAVMNLITNYAILIPYTTPYRENNFKLLIFQFLGNYSYEKDHMYLKFYALMQAMTLEQLQQFLPQIDGIIEALNRTQQEACFTKEALWIHCCRALEAAFVREVDFPQTILDFEKEKYERCVNDWDTDEGFNFETFCTKYGIILEEDKERLRQKRSGKHTVIDSASDRAKLEHALTQAAAAIPQDFYCCLDNRCLIAAEKLRVKIPAETVQQAAHLRVERRPDPATLTPQSQWKEGQRELYRSHDDKRFLSWLLEIMRINGEDPSTILEGFFGDLSENSEALLTLLQEFNRVFLSTKLDDKTLQVFAQAQDHVSLDQLKQLPCFGELLPHLQEPVFQTYVEQALDEEQALSKETSRFTFEVLVTHASSEQLQTVLQMCSSNKEKLQSIIRALNQHSHGNKQKEKLQMAMRFVMSNAEECIPPSEIVRELNYYELSTFLEIATNEQILAAFLSEALDIWEHENLESCAKDIAERVTPEQFAYLVNNCSDFEHFCLLLTVGLQNETKTAVCQNIQAKLNEMGCGHIVNYFKETHQRFTIFNFILTQILKTPKLFEAFIGEISMDFIPDLVEFVICHDSSAASIGSMVHNNAKIDVRKQRFLQAFRDEVVKKKGQARITQGTLTTILQAFKLPEEGDSVAAVETSPEPRNHLALRRTPLRLPKSPYPRAPLTPPGDERGFQRPPAPIPFPSLEDPPPGSSTPLLKIVQTVLPNC